MVSISSPRLATALRRINMRTRRYLDVAGLLVVPRRRHAVVIGGSLAGMLAARVLSDHFDGVTLLERDRFPEAPAARNGLPQGRHAHILLERGSRVVERFLPGLTGELVQAGAEPLDATRDVAWMSPYGWYVRCPGGLLWLACTRGLIDWGVRGRVAALPNVRIRQGADVAGLIRGPGEGQGGPSLSASSVLCKVNGRQYLHLVKAIDGNRFQIGNNRGRINGWISAHGIYGKCVRIE